MVADQITHRVTVTPSTPVEAFDDQAHGTGIRIGAVTVELADWHGDAGIIAAAGSLIDALESCRSAAMERERRRIRGSMPGLPDTLETATMADALAGWTESEKAGAWGNR